MIHDGQVYGTPLVQFTDDEADLLGIAAPVAGMLGYASDTGALGHYDGVAAAWVWSNATPLIDLGSYAQGSLIYGGVADWGALVHPAATNRVLQSTAAEVAWSANAVTFPAAGAVPVGTGAANQVAYWTDANTLAGDAGLLVDAANDLFIVADAGGIGNNIATARLLFDSVPTPDTITVKAANLHIDDTYDEVFDDVHNIGALTFGKPRTVNFWKAAALANNTEISETLVTDCDNGFAAYVVWAMGLAATPKFGSTANTNAATLITSQAFGAGTARAYIEKVGNNINIRLRNNGIGSTQWISLRAIITLVYT